MKVLTILMGFLIIFSSGCLTTTKITLHNQDSVIVESENRVYFVPGDKLVRIDLKSGEVEEVKE